jgi:hypothetical protein
MIPLADRSERFQQSTWSWRMPKFDAFPPTVRALARQRLEQLDQVDYTLANRTAAQLARQLKTAHLAQAFDEHELRSQAENYARTCAQIRPEDPFAVMARLGAVRRENSCDGPVTWLPVRPQNYAAEMRTFAARASFARSVGIEVLTANRSNRFFGLSARLEDPLWWRRQLRKMWSRQSEECMRALGVVRKGAEVYASDSAVRLRADQQRRMKAFLERSVGVNELGEVISLEQLAEHSLANPALRRGELMARIKGFEQIADQLKWEGVFVTVTAPSAYHPQLMRGAANPRYIGATVRQAQQWLCATWARVRSQLDRDGIRYFGARVAEPHHDGTPHWHMLLFVPAACRDQLVTTVSEGWLREFGDEPGAYEHRVRVERIDKRKGSATGYLAKYIAKNLDAAGVIHAQEAGETGTAAPGAAGHGVDVATGLARVLAWSAVHGIRQFQQLGGPPVGLYREARRVRDSVPHADLERARGHADRGDWRGFCFSAGYPWARDDADRRLDRLRRADNRARRAAGLPRRRRHKTTLRMVYADTGRRNRYGELTGAQGIGLSWGGAVAGEIFTRPHQWRITTAGTTQADAQGTVQIDSCHIPAPQEQPPVEIPSPLGPVAITVRTETDCDDPAQRWYHRTQALIRQLACQYQRAITPAIREKWFRAAVGDRKHPAYWHQETTGPPH